MDRDPNALMALFERRLSNVKQASPLALPQAVRDFVETAAAIIREQQNRIDELERANLRVATYRAL